MVTTQQILIGDVRDQLATLPDCSVQCVITSPPYWGLRDYGVAGQIGSEPTFEEYAQTMVDLFRDVRRVLRADGTLWLNLGDTYQCAKGQARGVDPKQPARRHLRGARPNDVRQSLPAKNLIGIPWRVALALQADGWFLRQDLIWHKPSPMPSSAKDRFCTSHEYVFMLTKSPRYFFDWLGASEPASGNAHSRGRGNAKSRGLSRQTGVKANESWKVSHSGIFTRRMGRSVWRITAQGYRGAHFAVYPPGLVERCLQAGTSSAGCCLECGRPLERTVERIRVPTRPGTKTKLSRDRKTGEQLDELVGKPWASAEVGNRDPLRHVTEYKTTGWVRRCDCPTAETVPCTVLDPFLGSGTTLAVAKEWGRSGIGIELNPDYAALARQRIGQAQPRMIELAEVC